MKNIWKNVLGVALIAAISSGAAIGTSTYLMNKNQRPVELASGVENTFKQPYRLTNYGTVAAENIDFTTAAESAIHGVVHIKATANAQASNGDGGQQYMDPFEYFFGFGGRGGFQRPQQQPRVGAGSGVIISTDGYIITNNHVIDGADELEVTLNDNRKFPAKMEKKKGLCRLACWNGMAQIRKGQISRICPFLLLWNREEVCPLQLLSTRPRPARRRGRPPGAARRCPCASCAFCLPSAFRGACAYG